MSVSRRTAMSILGIGTAAPALAAEDFMQSKGINSLPTGNDFSPKLMASALRNLAAAIESGEIQPERIGVSAELKRDDLVMQHLTVDFIIPVVV